MNYVDFFSTETCCDFFTIRLFHSVFFFCYFIFSSVEICHFSIEGASVSFTANRWEDFYNFRYILPVLLPPLSSSLFYDHIIAFSLMVLPSKHTQSIYLVCHWRRYHHWIPTEPIFFPFEMTQTVSRLWNSNEITSHTPTVARTHTHTHTCTIKSICLRLKLSSKKNGKTVDSQFHFVWAPVNP